MVRHVEIAVLAAEALVIDADAFVVVDTLRATTTIATLFTRGITDLVVVDDVNAARARAKAEGRVLFGEVGGLRPEGFDYGNSPVEATSLDLNGRGAVHFTGNGTRTLCSVSGRGQVVTGSLANITACAAWASSFELVCVVCAGDEGSRRFSLEDFAVAGAITRRLVRDSANVTTGDSAGLALELPGYEDWISPSLPQQTERSSRFIVGASHARTLVGLGLGADVQFATQEDTSSAVPVVVESGAGWARLEDATRRTSQA
jgi:2-phosphosulfolactate phosphatase